MNTCVSLEDSLLCSYQGRVSYCHWMVGESFSHEL